MPSVTEAPLSITQAAGEVRPVCRSARVSGIGEKAELKGPGSPYQRYSLLRNRAFGLPHNALSRVPADPPRNPWSILRNIRGYRHLRRSRPVAAGLCHKTE